MRRVGQRDGWVCGICRWPVDPDRWRWHGLDGVHHQADLLRPEVDHCLPKGRGGSLLDDNCQIAHVACNRHKYVDRQMSVDLARLYLVNRRREDALEWELGLKAR